MPYQSVDQLQKALANDVFGHTMDAKKAAGRALGTLIEIITFYLLKAWGFEYSIAIEKGLAEYGNPDITHNVEFSLHPILRDLKISICEKLPLTSTRILKALDHNIFPLDGFKKCDGTLLSTGDILRNSCTIAESPNTHVIADLISRNEGCIGTMILEQYVKPYAMFECKRVGIEEGAKKGPQTIEKAKQGAYVAKAVSSLHKMRVHSGELRGLIYRGNGVIYTKPYNQLLAEVVGSDDKELLNDFVLTVGVVSNHGNWFTSENHNKELKVLAQSYDWLLFLTDAGLTEFITELLLHPEPLLIPAQTAFMASYAEGKKKNVFTKVQMDYKADQVLQAYFVQNLARIEKWFNIITPATGSMVNLKSQIEQLRAKNWRIIHEL